MKRKPYKRYTWEFKVKAVRLAETADQRVTQVARQLGIRVNQLYKWKQQLAQAEQGQPGQRRTGATEELALLRGENAQLQEEVQILKKAAAYFATESL